MKVKRVQFKFDYPLLELNDEKPLNIDKTRRGFREEVLDGGKRVHHVDYLPGIGVVCLRLEGCKVGLLIPKEHVDYIEVDADELAVLFKAK